MPKFECVGGGQVFIPADRILQAESGEGGLTSQIVFASAFPGKAATVEVAHSVNEVAEATVAELSKVRG